MNLPNKITLSRILLLPVFLVVGLIVFPGHYFVAGVLFILLAVTDFLDGYLARKNNIVTNLGKFMDPIADKLLCTTALLLMMVGGDAAIIPEPFGIICVFLILLRDYAVTGLRQIAQLKGVIIPADKLGKIKANFQYVMTVVGFVFAGLRDIESIQGTLFLDIFKYFFWLCVAATTIIVLVSGVMYLVKNASVFAEDKKEEKVEEKKVEENIEKKGATAKTTSSKKATTNTKTATKKQSTKKTTK